MNLLLVSEEEADQSILRALTASLKADVHIDHLGWADALASKWEMHCTDVIVVSLVGRAPGWCHEFESETPLFLRVPLVMLAAVSDHSLAIEGFRAGALDWLIPNDTDPSTVPSLLDNAIARHARLRRVVHDESRYRAVLDHQSDLICRFWPDGTLNFVNHAYARHFGQSKAELEGQSFLRMVPAADRVRVLAQLDSLTPASPATSFDHEWVVDGRSTWTQWTDSAVFDTHGTLLEYQSIGQDITRRRMAERRAVENEARFRSMYENAPVMMHVVDARGTLVSVNRCWANTLGYREDEVLGLKPTAFLTEASRLQTRTQIADVILNGRPLNNVATQLVRKDGRVLDVLVTANAECDAHGDLLRITAVGVEITERVRVLQALKHEKERLRTTLASIGDAVITTDAHHQVDYLNPTAAALTGWCIDDAIGSSLRSVFQRCDLSTAEPIEVPLDIDRLATEPETLLLRHRHGGTAVAVELTASPIKAGDGQVFGLVLVFRDVTEARAQRERMVYQANHDSLTGLLNRRAFEEQLARMINGRRADDVCRPALCFLDLDRFKLVNDSCGHAAGDELLCEITELIRQQLRERDTLARLGGDEFAVLLEPCPMDTARHVMDDVREAVANYRYRFGEQVFSLGVSIGMVDVEGPEDTVEILLQAADSACYAAKEAGRNRVYEFQRGDFTLKRRQEENLWVPRLADALDNDLFELHAQTIEPADGRLDTGAHLEVLLRLRNADGTLIPPGAFIPIAERFQIMHRLDRWVITQSLRWLAAHRHDLPALDSFGINLSGQSLNEPQFLSFVESLLDDTGIPGEKICFEITETAAIDNVEGAQSVMHALNARGCRFALDDFGSGLSSFAYLRSLPVDFLKIDGLFVRDILDDSTDFAMVRTINDIGQLLGKQTIAEYVENEAIQQRLVDIGVDWVQGYGVGKPTPLAELWASRVAARAQPVVGRLRCVV